MGKGALVEKKIESISNSAKSTQVEGKNSNLEDNQDGAYGDPDVAGAKTRVLPTCAINKQAGPRRISPTDNSMCGESELAGNALPTHSKNDGSKKPKNPMVSKKWTDPKGLKY